MPFTIRDLPLSMRRQGFTRGATLMERWFNGPARAMTDFEKRGRVDPGALPAHLIDERTITMEWLLGFERARSVHATLLDEWHHIRARAGQGELLAKLRAGSRLTGRTRFGNLAQPAKIVDRTCQINIQKLGSSFLDPIDDLFAAIANASFKIAVSGMVEPFGVGKVRITIDEIGTYLRDTYDFNGDQPLGSWSRTGFSRAAVLAADIPIDPATADNDGFLGQDHYYRVDNGSFRAYRQKFGHGCDFTLFSDVKRHMLGTPVIWEMTL